MTLWNILIGAVACYGAALSTYLLVAPRIKLQRSLQVHVTIGYLNQSAGLSEPMLMISATNRGQKPITLNAVGLNLPGSGPVMFLRTEGDVSMPHALASSKTCRFWIPAQRVARALKESGASGRVRIVGLLADEMDRAYRSRSFRFDRDAYEQAAATEPFSAAVVAPATVVSSGVSAAPVTSFKW